MLIHTHFRLWALTLGNSIYTFKGELSVLVKTFNPGLVQTVF